MRQDMNGVLPSVAACHHNDFCVCLRKEPCQSSAAADFVCQRCPTRRLYSDRSMMNVVEQVPVLWVRQCPCQSLASLLPGPIMLLCSGGEAGVDTKVGVVDYRIAIAATGACNLQLQVRLPCCNAEINCHPQVELSLSGGSMLSKQCAGAFSCTRLPTRTRGETAGSPLVRTSPAAAVYQPELTRRCRV